MCKDTDWDQLVLESDAETGWIGEGKKSLQVAVVVNFLIAERRRNGFSRGSLKGLEKETAQPS